MFIVHDWFNLNFYTFKIHQTVIVCKELVLVEQTNVHFDFSLSILKNLFFCLKVGTPNFWAVMIEVFYSEMKKDYRVVATICITNANSQALSYLIKISKLFIKYI